MIRDTLILFGRTMKHVTRFVDTIITTALMPIAFMLLFYYVFGGAIKASLGGASYINYLLPGILIMTIASGISYVGYRLFEDKQKGMFSRVKSMPIKSSSFLWAHVLVSVIANLISLVIVIALALVMGFRSNAGLMNWLAILAILILFTLSLTWLMIIPGLLAKTMTGASVLAYPLTFLPMLSSAFVPTDTMPSPVRWFAENQPMTSVTDSLRHLLTNQPVGNEIWTALIWTVIIMMVSFLFANQMYKKAV